MLLNNLYIFLTNIEHCLLNQTVLNSFEIIFLTQLSMVSHKSIHTIFSIFLNVFLMNLVIF